MNKERLTVGVGFRLSDGAELSDGAIDGERLIEGSRLRVGLALGFSFLYFFLYESPAHVSGSDALYPV
jgi:hypothetical protein